MNSEELREEGTENEGMLRVLLRAMDAPPLPGECSRALLSPDKHLLVEQAATDKHLLRFRALLSDDADAPLPELDTMVPGETLPAYAWARHREGRTRVATLLAATEAGVVVVRYLSSSIINSTADARNPLVVRHPQSLSSNFSIPWLAKEREVVDTDPVPHAFIYQITDGVRGLFVPMSVTVLRVLGIFVDCDAQFTCVCQVRNQDGNIAYAIAVLAVLDNELKTIRFIQVAPTDDKANVSVTCCDWACFFLVNNVVHIINTRNAARFGSVDFRTTNDCDDKADIVVVSSDLKHLLVASSTKPIARVIDLAKYFRSTPPGSWLLDGINITRRNELVPKGFDDDDLAVSSSADVKSTALRADLTETDEALEWYDYLQIKLTLPESNALEMDAEVAGDFLQQQIQKQQFEFSQNAILTKAVAMPGVADGFSRRKSTPDGTEHQQQQEMDKDKDKEEKQKQPVGFVADETAEYMICLGVPPQSSKVETRHFALMITTDSVAWFRSDSKGEDTQSVSELWLYSRGREWNPSFQRFDKESQARPVLVDGGGYWYLICGADGERRPGLVAVFDGMDEQQVINNLIMFEMGEVADKLCAQNAWDSKARRLNTLSLSLKYKQLDIVEHVLANLDADQQDRGITMLLEHVRGMVEFPAQEEVNSKLIRICTRYVATQALSAAIESVPAEDALEDLFRESNTASHNSDESVEPEPERNGSNNNNATGIICFAKHLASLRQISRQILHLEPIKQSTEGDNCPTVDAICAGLNPEELFERNDLDRWSRMGDVQIVREALLSNRLPSAISYLRCTRAPDDKQVYSLKYIRLMASELAFQACCDGNFLQAAVFLDNAGIRAPAALGELLFNTSRRQLRHGLQSFLQLETKYLPSPELCRTADMLENLFQSPSLYVEYEKQKHITKSRRFVMQHCNAPRHSIGNSDASAFLDGCSEVDDITKKVLSEYGMELVYPSQQSTLVSQQQAPQSNSRICVVAETESQNSSMSAFMDSGRGLDTSDDSNTKTHAMSTTGGYIKFSLNWLSKWSDETIERILIERDYQLGSRNTTELFAYAMAHNSLALTTFWLEKVLAKRLQQQKASGPGEAFIADSFKSSRVVAIARDCGFSAGALALATEAHRELLRNGISKFGFFAESEVESFLSGVESATWSLLQRMAQADFLFLANAQALPAAFHGALCSLLLDKSCIPALMEYVFGHPDRMQLDAAQPSWGSFCAMLSSGDGSIALSAAALLNARLVMATADKNQVIPSEKDVLTTLSKHPPVNHALLGLIVGAYVSSFVLPQSLSEDLSRKYPTLNDVLSKKSKQSLFYETSDADDIYSSLGDVSLSNLLNEHSLPLISRHLYGGTRVLGSTLDSCDVGTRDGAGNCHYDLGIAHFMSNGNPFVARTTSIVTSNTEAVKEQARNYCLDHPGDVRLVMACACLLELLGEDSLLFRVDTTALAIMVQYCHDDEDEKGLRNLVSEARSSEQAAIRVADRLKQCAGEVSKLNSSEATHRARQLGNLTALYCRVHGLSLPVELLEHLAEKGDWATFLLSATDYHFPASVVIDVIKKHWHGQAVKEHLLEAFAGTDAEEQNRAAEQAASDRKHPDQFLTAVEAVERFHVPVKDVSMDRIDAAGSKFFPLSFVTTKSMNGESAALEYIAFRTSNIDVQHGIKEAYPQLLKTDQLSIVVEACSLYTPQSLFRFVANFFRTVQQRRYRDAGTALADTLDAILSASSGGGSARPGNKKPPVNTVEEAQWCMDALVAECQRVCEKAVSTNNRRFLSIFLGLLENSGIQHNPRCSRKLCFMQSNFSAMGQDEKVPLELIEKEPTELVDALLERKQFALALAVSQNNGLDCSTVYFHQADDMVEVRRKQECVWNDERERVALWNRISLFLTNRIEHLRGGEFFFARSHEIDKEIASKSATFIPSRERLELLRIAFYWYAGKPGKYAPLSDEMLQSGKKLQCRDPDEVSKNGGMFERSQNADKMSDAQRNHIELLGELEIEITLIKISIRAQVPLPPLDRTGFAGGSDAVMGLIVDHLVESGQMTLAHSLCQRFEYNSDHLKLADMLHAIASGTIRMQDSSVESLLRNIGVWNDEALQSNVTHNNYLGLFSRIVELVPTVKTYTTKVIANYRAAQQLHTTFSNVVACRPMSLLGRLVAVSDNSAAQETTKAFISAHGLTPADVGTLLANILLKWFLDSTTFAYMKHQQQQSPQTPRKQNPAGDSQPLRNTVMSVWPREKLVEMASLAPQPSEIGKKLYDVLCKSCGFGTDHEEEPLDPAVSAAISAAEALLKSKKQVQEEEEEDEKLEDYSNIAFEHEAEVEVAIMAWTFFEVAGNSEGCQTILSFFISRCEVYARKEEFSLHCRIITSTRAYRDLTPLFDALYDNNRFEMLLSSEGKNSDSSNYQAALVRYLKERHPTDTETLSFVCLRFGLFTDLGKKLEECAMDKLRVYAEAMKPVSSSELRMTDTIECKTESGVRSVVVSKLLGHELLPALSESEGFGIQGRQTAAEKILNAFYKTSPDKWYDFFARCSPNELTLFLTVCMQELLQAADHYSTMNSLENAARCFHFVALVQLQMRVPKECVLFLPQRRAVDVMLSCRSVRDAFVVCSVYRLRKELSRAVYAQVVAYGNMEYADELRRSMSVPKSLWYEVAKLFELDVISQQSQPQQKQQQQQLQQQQQQVVQSQLTPAQLLQQQQQQRMAALAMKGLPAIFSVSNSVVKTRNMRTLLLRLDDRFVMYDIAVKLHFNDLATKIKQTIPGLKYFVQ